MKLIFDHIVVVAPSLDEGVRFVKDHLGITVPAGGQHPQMGTHNCLMRLGQDEFLEIIAIDPGVSRPERARWFRLDTLPASHIGLGNWIVCANNLEGAQRRFPPSIGEITHLQRGDLRWRILVPDDGGLPFDGGFPTLIEWPATPYPGAKMPDLGCQLIELTIHHPNAEIIADRLADYLHDARIRFVVAPRFRLSAHIETPTGIHT